MLQTFDWLFLKKQKTILILRIKCGIKRKSALYNKRDRALYKHTYSSGK